MPRTRTRPVARHACTLLAGALLLSTACGTGSGDDSAGRDGGDGVDPNACPIGAIDEAGGGPVEIDFWHAMIEQNGATLEQLADEFNASQDRVQVNVVFQGQVYDEVLQKYTTAARSGDPSDLPDLVQLEDTSTQTMIDSGTVLPAQACIEATDYPIDDFVERAVAFYTVQDELYPMPWNVSSLLLYYNEQAFAAAGLDPATPPRTLEEVREASRTIVDAGVADAGFAIQRDPWWLEQITAAAGEEFVNNENGRAERATEATFENDVALAYYEWLDSMVDEDLAINAGGPDDVDNLLAVAGGQVAMTMSTSASLGTARAVLESGQFPNVELGIGPKLDLEPREPSAIVAGGTVYLVNAGSPAEQEAAWEFMAWLDEPEQQATWAIGTGYVPIRESAAELPQIQELWADEPEFKVAYDQLLGGELTPATEGPVIGPYKEIRDEVTKSLDAMLGEGKAPEDALADAVSAANALLEDYDTRN